MPHRQLKQNKPALLLASEIYGQNYFSAFSGLAGAGSGFFLARMAAMIFLARSGFSINAFFAASLPWPMTLHDPTTYQPATWSSVATVRVSVDTDFPVCP